MDARSEKVVRFKDWSSESYFNVEEDGYPQRKVRPRPRDVFNNIRRGIQRRFEKTKNLRKPANVHPVSDATTKILASKMKILDPQGSFLQKWNKIFVIACVLAVSVDPLFFYIPIIDVSTKCLSLNKPLQIIASVLRTFFDLFYILHIAFKFRTGFIAPSSRVFGRGELIDDPKAIAKRYLSSYFIIDVLSIIPLPQAFLLPMRFSVPSEEKDWLKYAIFIQYVPRFLRIYPLFTEVTRTSGILTETAWAGAAYNLFLYMLASHVVGAFWYLFSVESELRCWHRELRNATEISCLSPRNRSVTTLLNHSCLFKDPDDIDDPKDFNYGIYIDPLKYHVVESTMDFPQKIFFCFWWGLRNLSSLGQNLKTSTYVGEIIFACFIAIFGLVLFSLLIGNMQKYLQSVTVRVEEMRIKRRDAERWMSHRMLPEHLRERIRRYEHYKWQENRGVDEETLICNLPKDLRRDIKHHLCLDLLKKVPMFETMDGQLLDALCDGLKPVLYTEKSAIIREGDPVDQMLFIMRGNLATMTTNGGRTGFFNSFVIKAGDFCGEELLTWALDPNSSSNLPISTRTVESLSEVEAFTLMANDLKHVASQFRRLHNKYIQHTFRYYSLQWRTWAACFIQVAWRRHCKRKIEKSLREAEDRLQDALAKEEGSSVSFGATIYAARFAANALRGLRKNNGERKNNRMSQRLLPLLPQKPTELDFTAQALGVS
ncbi:hypothetical protein K1719_044832 [Acacia pycnantha]|nr:hypothetical protein K1719_044832 [Acacia pycnantha]